MKTSYTKLIEAMTQKDWQSATELFTDVMEQKVAQRLAQEKQGLHEDGTSAAVRANRRASEMNRNAAGVKEACGKK